MARKRVTPLSAKVDYQLYIIGMDRFGLATGLGISYQYLSNILSGRTLLPIDISRKMGELLEMKDEELRKLAIQYEQTA